MKKRNILLGSLAATALLVSGNVSAEDQADTSVVTKEVTSSERSTSSSETSSSSVDASSTLSSSEESVSVTDTSESAREESQTPASSSVDNSVVKLSYSETDPDTVGVWFKGGATVVPLTSLTQQDDGSYKVIVNGQSLPVSVDKVPTNLVKKLTTTSSSSSESSSASSVASSETKESSSTAKTESKSETSQSTEKVSKTESSVATETVTRSTKTETSAPPAESASVASQNDEDLYAATLSKVAAEGNPNLDDPVGFYAFYDINGDGTKELITGATPNGSEIRYADSIYYLKDGVPTLLAFVDVKSGVHGGFSVLPDGRVSQVSWVTKRGTGTEKIYQFSAEKNDWVLVEEKGFTVGNPNEAYTLLDSSKLDWRKLNKSSQAGSKSPISASTPTKTVTTPSTSATNPKPSPESSGLDVKGLMANDFSSIVGKSFYNNEGKVLTISADGSLNDGFYNWKKLRYVKMLGSDMLYFGPEGFVGDAGIILIPAGVEFTGTDSSRTRLVIINGSMGPQGPGSAAYYLDGPVQESEAGVQAETSSASLADHTCLPTEDWALLEAHASKASKLATSQKPISETEQSSSSSSQATSPKKDSKGNLPKTGVRSGLVAGLVGASLLAVAAKIKGKRKAN
ncbi:hypothetical protein [Streptococcus cuniculipharyngis]|uniref:Gram-positive cocci surface proteins LPxTG domain-containing protein n=1 Tax=Streptococcus cuniculipharyngis TaxID=1562651 RepID=A0A5C5SE67_9STRE|nr:hypothetical protein [Streptococcus cuniculipharyngis]TWS98213.1 hypothetical protein FRX57_04585 [Streptococcus cuniculipharyngis]